MLYLNFQNRYIILMCFCSDLKKFQLNMPIVSVLHIAAYFFRNHQNIHY